MGGLVCSDIALLLRRRVVTMRLIVTVVTVIAVAVVAFHPYGLISALHPATFQIGFSRRECEIVVVVTKGSIKVPKSH